MLLNRSWGARGHPFAQHYSCPTVLRCSIGPTNGGCGDISLCGKNCCLNRTGLPQASSLRSIGKAATSVLPPLPPLYFSFQNENASYAGRSGRASVRSRRLADRWFLQLQSQTCHKFVPADAATWNWARLLLPSVSWKKQMPRKSPSDKLISSRKKFIFQNSAQTAFKSLRLLRRRLDLKSSLRSELFPSRRSATACYFSKSRGERAQRSKKFNL